MHFYCLHALTGGNQRIQIREKTLEFSTVLSAPSPLHSMRQNETDTNYACCSYSVHECFPAYSLRHLSLVTDKQESVLEVCGLLLAISVESSLLY